ncbi:transglutaminase domain-containing protein [Thermaerobacter sp. PB12/4term]|uniref:transglutaminase TgpA family protein n=1 Tax=Thermaerobacter sp. PB12/4term TaxID=2293838 RepID=UPI000E32553C|nr:transglutaminase domain-containing protein [Thermaerobacter sp. PB12/4term]QIA26379.1 transglutaminase domain-containing protein [Thermaerobacter sp. PB12/4term]
MRRTPAGPGPARVPVLSPWYALLVVTGVASTLALVRGLMPFLGWPPLQPEPLDLVLALAALLWAPLTFPWLLLALAGGAAAWVGWLALRHPERLATFLDGAVPGLGAGMAARWGPVLQDLWLGAYEQLPSDLLWSGTALVAGLHLGLVFLASRRPGLALVPPVAGGLLLLLAWFYGDLPRPEGALLAYLCLAFTFVALARGASAGPARRAVPGRLALPVAVQALAVILVAALLAGAVPFLDEPAADWVAVTSVANRLLPFTVADRTGGWGAVPGAAGRLTAASRQFLGGPFFPDPTPLLEVRLAGEDIPATVYLRGPVRVAYDGRSWGPPVDVAWASRQGLSGWLAGGGPGGDAWYHVNGYGDPGAPLPVLRDARTLEQEITPQVPVHPYLYGAFEVREVDGRPPLVERPQPGIHYDPGRENPVMRTADSVLMVLHPVEQPYTVRSLVPRVDPAAAREAAARAEALNPRWRDDPALRVYLQLPEGLPQRVRDLAARLTAGQGNAYDQARAIERYLRGFRYDPNMPFMPRDRDFVDFFLFDLQRGYCVAFASAAVVLLRSAGLPARWVEGFVIPTGGRPGTYPVTYAQAHAWPEVLIPGYGWIPLEPTPAYPEGPLLPASTGEGPGTGGDEGATGPELPLPTRRPQPVEDPAEPAPAPGARRDGAGAGARQGASWGWAAGLALGGLLAGGAATVLWRRRRRGLPADPARAARAVFVRVERWLDRLGYGRPPAMTAREYAGWLQGRLPQLAPAWERLATLYESARYAPEPAALSGEAVRDIARTLRRDLERHFGWRFRWVLLVPDTAALAQAAARRVRRWGTALAVAVKARLPRRARLVPAGPRAGSGRPAGPGPRHRAGP